MAKGHRSCRLRRSGYCSMMSKKCRNAPLQEITITFNQGRPRRVSQRTIRRVLREEGYQRRVIRKAIRLRVPNRRNRLAWCRLQRQIVPACNWVLGELYLVIKAKWKLGLINASIFGEKPEKSGSRNA